MIRDTTDQDYAAPEARQCGEEGPGGDRGQVLSAAARLRQGEHRQPRADGQAAHGESEARPGRAHQARNKYKARKKSKLNSKS